MSDTVRVSPTPIQRNKFDVAVELTQLHVSTMISPNNNIEELFAKYYALASYCDKMGAIKLQKLVSPEIMRQVGEYKSSF